MLQILVHSLIKNYDNSLVRIAIIKNDFVVFSSTYYYPKKITNNKYQRYCKELNKKYLEVIALYRVKHFPTILDSLFKIILQHA